MNADTISDLEIVAVLPPIHPGEILREEFIKPLNLSAGKVAKACHVPRTRIERIVREEIGVTSDTAIRLGRYFGTSIDLWINLQAHYDAEIAKATAAEIASSIEPLERSAA